VTFPITVQCTSWLGEGSKKTYEVLPNKVQQIKLDTLAAKEVQKFLVYVLLPADELKLVCIVKLVGQELSNKKVSIDTPPALFNCSGNYCFWT